MQSSHPVFVPRCFKTQAIKKRRFAGFSVSFLQRRLKIRSLDSKLLQPHDIARSMYCDGMANADLRDKARIHWVWRTHAGVCRSLKAQGFPLSQKRYRCVVTLFTCLGFAISLAPVETTDTVTARWKPSLIKSRILETS